MQNIEIMLLVEYNIFTFVDKELISLKAKKKLVIIPISLLLLCAAVFAGYIHYINNNYIDFNSLLNNHSNMITKVYMERGLFADNVSTTNKSKIQEIIKLVNNRSYTKAANQEYRAGFTFFYDFYVGNTKAIRITGSGSNIAICGSNVRVNGSNAGINGTYYNVDKPISVSALTKWFHSLPAKQTSYASE